MNKLVLLLFLLYSLIIIFINNIYIILSIVIFELILLFIFKINFKLKNTIYFILFIFIFNYLLINLNSALLVALRLLTMYLIVILVINKIGVNKLAYTLSSIFHSKNLYLIISIALSFIPILKDEIHNIRTSLLVKNYPCTLINVLRNPKIFVVTFFHNLFQRVSELEKTLIVMGFDM